MKPLEDQAELSKAAMKALRRAYKRPSRAIRPTPGFYGRAQELLLLALRNRGLITDDPAPVLTDEGVAFIEERGNA